MNAVVFAEVRNGIEAEGRKNELPVGKVDRSEGRIIDVWVIMFSDQQVACVFPADIELVRGVGLV